MIIIVFQIRVQALTLDMILDVCYKEIRFSRICPLKTSQNYKRKATYEHQQSDDRL